MRRASDRFNDEQRKRVAAAVTAGEAKTSAEIVPVVATDSGRYDRGEDIVGLFTGIAAMAVVWVAFQREDGAGGGWDGLPLAVHPVWLLVVLVTGFVVGVAIAMRVAPLRRLFTPRREMAQEVSARARHLFFDQRVHHTSGAAGVLVYVSLFEHRVVVLADEAAFGVLGQGKIDEVTGVLRADLRGGDLTAALCVAIGSLADALGEGLPGGSGDVNELTDALVLID